MTRLEKTANIIRALSIISTTAASSGHPTSAMSAADIATVLFDKYFTFDLKNPKNPANDRFILSKGHAAPLIYALFALAGGLKREELLTLRQFGSRLEGHPTPRFPYADVTSGSLGQGLSIGAGIALYAKRTGLPNKTFVLLGDGEFAEGSNYEAGNFAAQQKLDNLIAILDVNALGQTGKTAYFHNGAHYEKAFLSFGWKVSVLNGHNFSEIDKVLGQAVKNKSGKPFAIVASTKKGKGVSFLEGNENFHGKAVKREDLDRALKELGLTEEITKSDEILFKLKKPKSIKKRTPHLTRLAGQTIEEDYKLGESRATREVFGEVLEKLGADENIYVIDGDTGNSTYTEKFGVKYPERFIQSYISEQNMVGVAVGLFVMGKIPVAATFGAFLTRAFDQIRMAAVSGANVKFCGSHAGVSIGEDGPSQMALEDISMFAPFPGSVILHPADAVSTTKLMPQFLNYHGIAYLRTLRPKTQVIYNNSEKFKIGGSKVLRSSKKDVLTIAACGITVFEALKAYDALKKKNISVRVVDCYSIKPLDIKTLKLCNLETLKPITVSVEDHFIHGGLGDLLSAELSGIAKVEKLGVSKITRSGTQDELLDYAGISAPHIVKKVRSFIK